MFRLWHSSILKVPLTCQFVSLNPKQDAVVFFRVIDGEKLGFQLIGEEFEQAVFDVSFVFGVAKTHFVPSRRGIRTICSGAQAKDVTHWVHWTADMKLNNLFSYMAIQSEFVTKESDKGRGSEYVSVSEGRYVGLLTYDVS